MTRRPPRPEEPPRGRRAIAPPPRIARATAKVVAEIAPDTAGPAGNAVFADIAARWREIVGDRTAQMCAPVKLAGKGARGVLHVAAKGPAALLVEADSARILEAVNTYCGTDVARRLAIGRAPAQAGEADEPATEDARALAPTAQLKLQAELASVDDPRLKAALLELGRETLSAAPVRDKGA